MMVSMLMLGHKIFAVRLGRLRLNGCGAAMSLICTTLPEHWNY